MSLESLTEELRRRVTQSPPLGHKVKFDLGDDGTILWDGTATPPLISNADEEAETTIRLSAENFEKLMTGGLDPTMAFMLGKLKVDGKMGVAMKIGSFLGE
ncbi:MAG TPA: SCP2 sterol-binding domain-containing protein [Alphaproteobacteria bacterium]|nr:SCP2 sterol-binding domain-containing protein [Alphaproteobacteria bacterium]